MNTQSMDRVVITDALQQLTPSMPIAGDSTDIKTLLIRRAAECWCALGLKERQWASPEAVDRDALVDLLKSVVLAKEQSLGDKQT
jgi:hypothetical protein